MFIDVSVSEDREIEITQTLLEKILVYEEMMTMTCDLCAELDCLLSFTRASKCHDYHRPVISEDNVIDIRQGRYNFFSHIKIII